MSEKFGLSRKQVKTAVIFLESQGLIKRHVKPVTLGTGRTINNVMFIELIPDQLSKITFDYDDQENNSWVPESTCTHPSRDPYGSLKVPTWVPESTHVGPSKHPCGSLEGRTYTKTTTKTTTEIPSNHSETCMENYRMVEERIREQIDVKSLYAVFPGYKETIDAIVTIIANLFTTQEKEIRIGNEKQSIEVVRAQMNKLNYSMVEVLINSLRGNTKRIIRPDRYLIKCIYNATLYSELMIENEVILDRFNGS